MKLTQIPVDVGEFRQFLLKLFDDPELSRAIHLRSDVNVRDDFSQHHVLSELNLSGIPAGGTTGQVLEKDSNSNYDASWHDLNVNVIESNVQTTDYTLVITDLGKVIEMNVNSANAITVPPNASVDFPVGGLIEAFQYGSGQTSIVAGVGVTIRSPGSRVALAAQYSSIILRQRALDEWALEGDLV